MGFSLCVSSWILPSISFGIARFLGPVGIFFRLRVQPFHGKLRLTTTLLGDSNSLVRHSLQGVWNCMRLEFLLNVWNIHCKYVFDN